MYAPMPAQFPSYEPVMPMAAAMPMAAMPAPMVYGSSFGPGSYVPPYAGSPSWPGSPGPTNGFAKGAGKGPGRPAGPTGPTGPTGPMGPGPAGTGLAPEPIGMSQAQVQGFSPVLDDGTAAMYLQQYFQLVKAHCDTTLMNKPAAVRELNGKLFPIIVEAFKRHDKDGDGVLQKTEAGIFFSLFTSDRLGFSDAARGLVVQHTGDSEKAAAQMAAYKKHKDVLDRKAFAAFNANEHGYLQLHEAVSALSIGSEKNDAVLKAFGLRPEDADQDDHYYTDHYA